MCGTMQPCIICHAAMLCLPCSHVTSDNMLCMCHKLLVAALQHCSHVFLRSEPCKPSTSNSAQTFDGELICQKRSSWSVATIQNFEEGIFTSSESFVQL